MLLRLLTVETQNNDLKGVLILKKHSREKLKKIIKKICKKSKKSPPIYHKKLHIKERIPDEPNMTRFNSVSLFRYQNNKQKSTKFGVCSTNTNFD